MQLYFSQYEWIALTRYDADDKNAMLATSKTIHDNNRI